MNVCSAAGGAALTLMALLVTSCQKQPEAELAQAVTAVGSSRQSQADVYAPAEFSVLGDSLAAAQAEINAQSDRFIPNFEKSRVTLAWVAAQASVVSEKARSTKEGVRLGVTSLLDSVTVSVDSLSQLVAMAPRGKGSEQDIELYQTDIAELRALLGAARHHLESEQFPQAESTARSISSEASSIHREVKAAIDHYDQLRQQSTRRRPRS